MLLLIFLAIICLPLLFYVGGVGLVFGFVEWFKPIFITFVVAIILFIIIYKTHKNRKEKEIRQENKKISDKQTALLEEQNRLLAKQIDSLQNNNKNESAIFKNKDKNKDGKRTH